MPSKKLEELGSGCSLPKLGRRRQKWFCKDVNQDLLEAIGILWRPPSRGVG